MAVVFVSGQSDEIGPSRTSRVKLKRALLTDCVAGLFKPFLPIIRLELQYMTFEPMKS